MVAALTELIEWRDIPEYEDYQVSNTGLVRRVKTGRILKGKIIALFKHQLPQGFTVASLVMLAFVGDKPDGMVVGHLNDDSLDSRLENLAYVKRQDVSGRCFPKGYNYHPGHNPPPNPPQLARKGSENPRAKLTERDITEMCQQYANGEPAKNLAVKFNVHLGTVKRIVRGKGWNHVTDKPARPPKPKSDRLTLIIDHNQAAIITQTDNDDRQQFIEEFKALCRRYNIRISKEETHV